MIPWSPEYHVRTWADWQELCLSFSKWQLCRDLIWWWEQHPRKRIFGILLSVTFCDLEKIYFCLDTSFSFLWRGRRNLLILLTGGLLGFNISLKYFEIVCFMLLPIFLSLTWLSVTLESFRGWWVVRYGWETWMWLIFLYSRLTGLFFIALWLPITFPLVLLFLTLTLWWL